MDMPREKVKTSLSAFAVSLLIILSAMQFFYMSASFGHTFFVKQLNQLGYGLGDSAFKLTFILTTIKYTLISIFQLFLIFIGLKIFSLDIHATGLKIPSAFWKLAVAVLLAFVYKFSRELGFALFHGSAIDLSISFTELWTKLHNPLAYYFLFLVPFAIPFFEEFFYRGFLYKVIEDKAGWKMAVLFSACLFSMFHTEKFLSFNLEIFIKGLLYGLLRKWDGSIWSSVTAHSTSNMILSWFIIRA
jgi:membrane protease YdiL (CAAX protease family)